MGQFTQLDPIGMRGGLNLYGYANGDPVNFRDPSGLAPGLCEGMEGQPVEDCLNVIDSSIEEINALFCDNPVSCWFWRSLGTISPFVAGFGDALTMGGTRKLRESGLPIVGCVGCVDYASGLYTAGEISGLGVSVLGGGSFAAAIRGNRFLFSSRPARFAAKHLAGSSLLAKYRSGKRFRLGVGRYPDGRASYRAAGETIERWFGNYKVEIVDMGSFENWITYIR